MKKTAVKFIAGALILCVLLWQANRVLAVKYDDGIYSVAKFYELEDNSVDVLILGSSHAYMSFNTGVLWREQGISSYLLTASAQPLWNSYYYLKEALKTQTPKLIVLEGYRLLEEEEYQSAGFVIKSTYGLKWSRNRIDAIKASVPREQWMGYLLGYTQYHDRYTELSEEDFTSEKKAERYRGWKGFEMGMTTQQMGQPDFGTCTGSIALMEKTEKYYRAILELAQEKNIPIMVVIAPFGGMTQEDQKRFRTAQAIAQEYEVPFFNYNFMEDEVYIDYGTDMYNTSHLNGRGSCKFTSQWGEYIAGQYKIPDHRGDPAYDSWEQDAAYLYALLEDVELRETVDADKVPEYLGKDNYHVFLSVDGYCQLEEETVNSVLGGLGIGDVQGGGLWYFAGGDAVWNSGDGEASRYFETERHDFGLRRVQRPDGGYDNEIVIDNQNYHTVENGINIVVFDGVTGIVADSFGIDADNDYQLCR